MQERTGHHHDQMTTDRHLIESHPQRLTIVGQVVKQAAGQDDIGRLGIHRGLARYTLNLVHSPSGDEWRE